MSTSSRRDEIDQIAYRLARELGHKQLYAADTKLDMDFDGVMGHAKLLSEYIAESPNLRLADPLQYLP